MTARAPGLAIVCVAIVCVAIVCVAMPAVAGPYHKGDPCEAAVADPVPTPLRDVGLDAQRSACLRTELAAGLTTHALIDTPGFRGLLGGDLGLAARVVIGGRLEGRLELGARVRLVDYVFAQNAVNKVTATRVGPVSIGAAYGVPFGATAHFAVVIATEVPYTRDDWSTVHAGGQLTLVVTGALAARWLLDARLGAIGATASSSGGDTQRLALRAGADLAWRIRPTVSLIGGAEAQAGWTAGLDTILARIGVQVQPRAGAWRGLFGIGVPLGGSERTMGIVVLGLARDLD